MSIGTIDISVTVSLLVALSIASERLVSIVKSLIPWLNQEKVGRPCEEGWRNASLQLLAVAAGILTAYLANPAIAKFVPQGLSSLEGSIALGLLASGGSGFWNSIQGYLTQVKDIKKLTVEEKRQSVADKRVPANP